ncbi:Autophagy protein 7 [Tilletia horrida]|uniref:Ubiquitin-like modifier-activating enzyme ATG7 n=1 Tax=Tilletia horrida TaxID=155126 RepID=A0AAN6GCL2_9BASI|nr:Autophagy protein 7 [Tilletia horrida]
MASTGSKLLQYASFSSSINPSFWHSFAELKIDTLQLSDAPLPLVASYATARQLQDRSTGEMVYLPAALNLEASSLRPSPSAAAAATVTATSEQLPRGAVPVFGELRNFNTVDEFKSSDKQALFNALATDIFARLSNERTEDPTPYLTRFLVLAFADLKKYKFFHWFAFPALVAKPAWEVETAGAGAEGAAREWNPASSVWRAEQLSSLTRLIEKRAADQAPGSASSAFWLLKTDAKGEVRVGDLASYDTFFADVPEDERTVGFIDPSAQPATPGWPLRNLLAYLALRFRVARIRVLCWKEDAQRSTVGVVRQNNAGADTAGLVQAASGGGVQPFAALAGGDGTRPSAVGWERNAQGKLAPKVADLGPLMDPTRLADQAVDLNLKLMRWRIMPDINLEIVQNTRCLLLGAGTLGCYVARALLGWGVRNITFVDSSTVSFSNPVRQPLFEFEDCLQGGKPKAECAAAALRKIYPGVNANGVRLSIPMPGHPIPPTPEARAQAERDITTLESLIDSHDAVFLLMDSRESRWLPTMLCASRGADKIVLNAALGFDTYLVMRHGAGVEKKEGPGAGSEGGEKKRLGCYFCNDIVAPADSLRDRTLDQMCTVTRPGLAPIAAASAVELLVSVLQHKDGVHAQPPPPASQAASSSGSNAASSSSGGVLGAVPHQIRGFLSAFNSMLIVGPAYERCTACSPAVVEAYRSQSNNEMLFSAFGEEGYLEKLTGLDQLKAETDGLLDEELDWDEEDEDEEGGEKEEGDGELL